MFNFRLALIYIILQIFTPHSLSNNIDLDIYFFSDTWSSTHFYPIFGATKYIFVLTLFLILFLTLLFVFFLEVILLRFSLGRSQSPNGIGDSLSRSKSSHGGIPLNYYAGILFNYYLQITGRTVQRHVAAMQKKGVLKREGTNKGKWVVVSWIIANVTAL